MYISSRGEMKGLLVSVVLFVVVHADDHNSWDSFQIRNKKVYKSSSELQLHQKIFNENLLKIEEHNKKYEQGLVSYKLGINKFSDLSDDEFNPLFTTTIPESKHLHDVQENFSSTNMADQELPAAIDWRSGSVVSAVKNQGNCGAYWTFSATGALESHLAIQTGELKLLSEQQLVDCAFLNDGCETGTAENAFLYVSSYGLTLEENYPYEAVKGDCNASRTGDSVVRTKGYFHIGKNNETRLKQIVGSIGPVVVAFNSILIKQYQEGVIDGECNDTLTHGGLIVGYGTDTRTGLDYWIIKNSWGSDWGDQGYFKLRMGSNLCGITRQACYPLLDMPEGPGGGGGNDGFSAKADTFAFLVLSIYLFFI